ncbi:centrosomin isoform X2 [Diabrotica virgifera virgifera]|uniref:Centrosomin N-terminal motif 1 domain-containing protein n=1 Tax=Diabrotica virgifera virgifera TaxID=50390 RepID=A0ABM5JIB5_DIAVI|nr:centrosomin isoform X2 [Diabrotica virgifera virgifera]
MSESAPTTETECSVSLADETTSPSQLQEITLEHDGTFSNTMGLRSPSGPMRGRSVKEFEEQLNNLKKENFHLKLRIYFLEEKMGSNFTLDKDNVVKKYIELQVDYANLKKEIEEKQDLLCQAVKAIELEDEEHKKYVADKEDQIAMFQQEIEDLRTQLQDIRYDSEGASLRSDTTGIFSNKASSSTTNEHQQRIKSLEQELQLEKENNASLQFVICQAETLESRCQNMQKELQAKEEIINTLQIENESLNTRISTTANQMKDMQNKLETSYNENQTLSKKITAESKKFDELVSQYSELKSKYCVQDPTTPSGATEKNPKHLQITPSETPKSSSSLTSLGSPSVSTPEKYNIDFEDLLRNSKSDKIVSVFTSLKYDYDAQKQKLLKLKAEQFKACEIIKNMIDSRNKANEEISQYQVQIKNLEKELESVVSKPTSDGDVPPKRVTRTNNEKTMEESIDDMEVADLYKTLTIELEAKIEILEATLKEKDNHIQKIREQYDELLVSLEDKENRITELEFELLAANPDAKMDRSSQEKGDTASEKRSSFYKQELEEKDKEIERLNVELKKCSCYLQEIVNKELWDKNKEIEKLHTRQVNSPEVLRLRKDLTGKEQQLEILKEKISELGLDLNISCDAELKDLASSSKMQHIKSLLEELKACKDERDYFKEKLKDLEGANHPEIIEKLKSHTDSLKSDLEKSEKLKRESNKICALLNCRLEELTVFLDSLLKQKSILGYIGMQKERKLREIINSSLDLSKSFNMSLGINADQSLAQLSNITSILNGSVFKDLSLREPQEQEESTEMLSIIPGNITLTYQSHLYKQSKKPEPNSEEVISALREQIINLKSELQLRDNELNRLNAGSKISDTDEDQRNKDLSGYVRELSKYVTPTKSNTTSTTLKYQSECHSESEGWSEPDRTVSRARMGLNQSLPNTSFTKVTRLSESTEDDSTCSVSPKLKLYYEKQQVAELQHQVGELRVECEQRSEQLKQMVARELYEQVKSSLEETKRKILQIELIKNELESQVTDLKKQIEELTNSKDELKENSVVKDKKVQNLMNLLEVEKTEKLRMANNLEKIIEKTKEDVETKQKECEELRVVLKKEMEEFVKKVESEHAKSLNEVEHKATEKVNKIENECSQIFLQKITEVQDNYSRNYIRRADAEEKLAEVDRLIHELDNLNDVVAGYESTIQSYKTKEQEFNNKVAESQEQIIGLRKELDSTTLQYSEAVMEKTKLANEKTWLEQELSRYSARDMELKKQLAEIRSEFEGVSHNYQAQISTLQKQKSELQVKISILESNNAELHNRFVRTNRVELSATMPNLSTVGGSYQQSGGFQRQFSHPSYSSEDNIEECIGYNLNHSVARNRQQGEVDRQEASASPDLGIESDQGRFSSLEIHHNSISRPLLQTIELTESMNNLLDGDNNPIEKTNFEGRQHCCQRNIEMASENNDLKRKLCRMKKALEETANQLHLANQRKRQVEKTICSQIHKTSQVLRQAKANLDSGSESDLLRM